MSAKDDRYNRSGKKQQRWRTYARRRYWKRIDEKVCTKCGGPRLSEAYCCDCLNAKQYGYIKRVYRDLPGVYGDIPELEENVCLRSL